jgi:hypothetical protein
MNNEVVPLIFLKMKELFIKNRSRNLENAHGGPTTKNGTSAYESPCFW